jgi:membrane-bound metal-dependent hydrolase YbcI (DUF457 family)
MSKPLIHAESSARKFGGVWQDYIKIHEFMDSSKAVIADNRHRALTHNSWFVAVVIPAVFGEVFKRESDGKELSSRDIAELHVLEDYKKRFIPSAHDFLSLIPFEPWMQNGEKGNPGSYEKLKINKPLNVD